MRDDRNRRNTRGANPNARRPGGSTGSKRPQNGRAGNGRGKRSIEKNIWAAPKNTSKITWIMPDLNRKKTAQAKKFIGYNQIKLWIVFATFIVLMALLIVRLVYINASSGDAYNKQVLSQLNYSSTTIPYRRGDITDRNGTVLATSEKVYNLIVDAYVMINSRVESEGDCLDPSLDALETYFDLDRSEMRDLVEENPESRYNIVARELTYDEIQEFQNLMDSEDEEDRKKSQYIKGIWFEDDYKRKYPYNSLACDLIGFTSAGNVGTYGIEQYYNDVLNGTNGREYGYLAGMGDLERTTVSPVNGYTVQSTIDVNIQRIVENVIWEFNEAIGSNNTAVLVMDPNNGEILAMASYPVFNLNDPRDLTGIYDQEELDTIEDWERLIEYNELWKNYTITDTYEAGSTVKTMTVAAALEEDVVGKDQSFICDGSEKYKDGNGFKVIPCNNISGHGTLSLSQSLMQSCNDALMQIAGALGSDKF